MKFDALVAKASDPPIFQQNQKDRPDQQPETRYGYREPSISP